MIRLVAVVALLAAYALLARFVLHGPVSGKSLAVSVGREAGSAGEGLGFPGRCRRRAAEGEWRCSLVDSEGSGGATYRVRMHPGSSCWDATLARDQSEGGMPREVHGCVHRWQWRLL